MSMRWACYSLTIVLFLFRHITMPKMAAKISCKKMKYSQLACTVEPPSGAGIPSGQIEVSP